MRGGGSSAWIERQIKDHAEHCWRNLEVTGSNPVRPAQNFPLAINSGIVIESLQRDQQFTFTERRWIMAEIEEAEVPGTDETAATSDTAETSPPAETAPETEDEEGE